MRGLRALTVAVSLVGVIGCGGVDADIPGPGDDGGTVRGGDGGLGTFQDAAGEPSDMRDGLDPDDAVAGPAGIEDCYPEPGVASCDAPSCGELRACCIGSGSCCAPVEAPQWPPTLPLATCVGMDVATCLTTAGVPATAFGTQPSRVESGGYFSAGDSMFEDSGVVLDTPVDLATRALRVGVTFTDSTTCDDLTCVESAAVALVERPTNTGEVVRPIVGLLYAAAPDRVSLLLGDEAVAAWPHEGSDEAWTLVVRPDGHVAVARNGETLTEVRFEPSRAAYLTLFGRSVNPGPDEASARLSNVATSVGLCDIPTAWDDPRSVSVVIGGSTWTEPIEEPSVLIDDESAAPLLAFRSGETLYVGRFEGGAVQASAVLAPLVLDGVDWAKAGAFDPELVRTEDGLALYFTGRDELGVGSIGRLLLTEPTSPTDALELAISPSDFELVSIDAPTVHAHPSGQLVLVGRAQLADTTTELRIFRHPAGSADPRDWIAHEPRHLETLTSSAERPVFDYAADAIGDPTLVVHDGAWKLFVTGRRGTRWAVALYASDNLLEWRRIPPETVLEGTADGADALGVRSADVARMNDRIELFYRPGGHAGGLLYRTLEATNAGLVGTF